MPKDMQLDADPAIAALKKMLHRTCDIKEKHRRPALRPHAPKHDHSAG